ncbi:MAG: cation-efflux pump [Rhizobiales bacterium]|nr:cation-efflux pump [Hyphomicrobiales bacterium]
MSANEKQRVAFVSMLASAALAGGKLLAGLATGSLGILSEAVHSTIDFGSTIMTLIAVRIADRPPDDSHHYGHAKVESVSALVATGLLFATTGWVAYEAIKRLVTGHYEVGITWWAVAIIAASIVVDITRSRALMRVARKTSSQALEADALNFSSDMWSSLVVLAGLAAVWAGYPAADPLAALVVAVFIARAAWKLAGSTLDTLLDAAPIEATNEIRRLAEGTEGVLRVKDLRVRPAGPTIFVSLAVDVARTMPVDDISRLRSELPAKIRGRFPNADVVLDADLVALDDETVFQRIMLIAARHRTAIHHPMVQRIGGRLAVSFDIEVDGDMPLETAHETATRLECDIRRELGPEIEVESHIEPLPERMLEGQEASESERKRVAPKSAFWRRGRSD